MSSNMFLVIRIKLVNQRELSFAPVNRSCFCITQFIAIISREFMLQRSCNRQIKLVKWIAISFDDNSSQPFRESSCSNVPVTDKSSWLSGLLSVPMNQGLFYQF